MWLEIKQLTRLQIIRYCEKLEKENKKLKEDLKLIKYYKSQMEEIKKESAYKIKKMKEKLRYYTKKS